MAQSESLRLFWIFLLISSNPLAQSQLDLCFAGFRHAGGNITLDGAAVVEKNGLLRLTDNTLRVSGHAFYDQPVRFRTAADGKALSFSTAFAFAIVPEYPRLGGHGFAFTLSPTRGLAGALPSQYLGLLNSSDIGNLTNHVFAVEFDTVQDFEFGDINDNHVGIDINSLTSNSSAPATHFPQNSTLNLKSGNVIQAWIDYDSTQKQINVALSPSSTKPKSPILTYGVDLSPILRDHMFIGFSSSTGLLASTHYVLGWSFKINGEAKSLSLKSLPKLKPRKKNRTVVTATVSVSALLAAALVIALFSRKLMNSEVIEPWELDIGPHRFKYKELKRATRGFRDKELIGFGGFGKVYKGVLVLQSTETEVAVKRISHESKQGLREFASEIASIGRLRHRNLVQLLGWCRRGGDLLLVYDFMPNGSLDKYLFENPKSVLSWEQRLKIIKNVALGLLYLHEEWEQAVIHRDVKAGNVLLDGDMNGRVGDFGLAKLYEHGSNPSTTRVVGTLGYLAPELTRTGKPTASSDVFAFGALLLEIVSGRRPIEPKALPEELILVDWVWEKWVAREIGDVVDSRLGGDFDELEVNVVVKLGLMCSSNWPEGRPTMRRVVRYLEGEVALPEAVAPPDAYDGKGGRGGGGGGGFEDYTNSGPASSCFEKVSTWSSAGEEVEVDVEAGEASPLPPAGGVGVR